MSLVPPIPSLRPLLWLNIGLAVLSGVGLFLPIKLSISLHGVVVSDGPTTVLTAMPSMPAAMPTMPTAMPTAMPTMARARVG